MSYASKVANRQGCGAEVRAGCHLGDVMLGRPGVPTARGRVCPPRAVGCREKPPAVPLFWMRVEKRRPLYHARRGRPGNRARRTVPCREMPPVVPRRAGRGRPAAAGLAQRAACLDAHPAKTVQRAGFAGADGPRLVQRAAFAGAASPRPVQGGTFPARGSSGPVQPAVFLGTPSGLVARRWAHLTRSPAIPERAAARSEKPNDSQAPRPPRT